MRNIIITLIAVIIILSLLIVSKKSEPKKIATFVKYIAPTGQICKESHIQNPKY